MNINQFRNIKSCRSKHGIGNVLTILLTSISILLATIEFNIAHIVVSMFIKIYLFICIINTSISVYTKISSKTPDVIFKYMEGVSISNYVL